jgi:hypothetical protein
LTQKNINKVNNNNKKNIKNIYQGKTAKINSVELPENIDITAIHKLTRKLNLLLFPRSLVFSRIAYKKTNIKTNTNNGKKLFNINISVAIFYNKTIFFSL